MRLFEIENRKILAWGNKPRSVAILNPIEHINKNINKLKIALDKYKKGNIIYRVLSWSEAIIDPYCVLSDPTIGERISANTKNYYTWIIDNSPNWKDYPKRSKSLICSTAHTPSKRHDEYIVLPFNNPTIGICPEYDLWFSFKVAGSNLNFGTLEHLNEKIDAMLEDVYKKEDYFTYEEFYRHFNNIDITDTTLYPQFFKNGSPYKTLEYWLNPSRNNFTNIKLSEYIETPETAHELWFSAPAILIKQKLLDQYIKDGKI